MSAWALPVYGAIAVAVVAPMYDRLQRQTRFLASLETVSVALFVVLWTVAIPLFVVLIIAATRYRDPRFGRAATACLVGVTSSLVALNVLGHRVSGSGLGWLTLLLSIVGGCFVGCHYQRWQWLRSILSVAALVSLLCPASLIHSYLRDSARPVIKEELTAGNPVPVVMVVFDCFCGVSLLDQNRQIDRHRFPNFAELAAGSNWYRNCTTVHPRTDRAVPAILTGELTPDARKPILEQHPQNLFTLLNATGKYKLTAFEPFTMLCPTDRFRDRVLPDLWSQWWLVTRATTVVFMRDLMPPDLPFELPPVPRNWFGLEHVNGADPEQRQGLVTYSWDIGRDGQFRHFLSCIEQSDQSQLWFGHFALPHSPWHYLPSGNYYANDFGIRQEWGAEGPLFEDWANDEQIVLQAHQQHLLQTGYVDRLIGDLLAHLRQNNLYDRCLLVVMADHGMSFRKNHSGRAPSDETLADIMSVPLFIKLPGQQAGDVIDLNVETTDVLPTILDVLQVNPAKSLAGQSVISRNFSEHPIKTMTDDARIFEVDASFEVRYRVLAEQLARFGTGEDPLRIFRIGPRSNLLGKRLEEIPLDDRSSIQIRPVNFDAQVEYGSSQLVPTHLQAMIEGGSDAALPARFAIAVDDTIWGTTQTFRVPYLKNYWRVMLPESAFREGANSIRVFQMIDFEQSVVLRECTIGSRTEPPKLQ